MDRILAPILKKRSACGFAVSRLQGRALSRAKAAVLATVNGFSTGSG